MGLGVDKVGIPRKNKSSKKTKKNYIRKRVHAAKRSEVKHCFWVLFICRNKKKENVKKKGADEKMLLNIIPK